MEIPTTRLNSLHDEISIVVRAFLIDLLALVQFSWLSMPASQDQFYLYYERQTPDQPSLNVQAFYESLYGAWILQSIRSWAARTCLALLATASYFLSQKL